MSNFRYAQNPPAANAITVATDCSAANRSFSVPTVDAELTAAAGVTGSIYASFVSSSLLRLSSEPVLLKHLEDTHQSTLILRLEATSIHRLCLPALLAFRRSGRP